MSKYLDHLRDIEAAVEKTEQEAEAEATRHQPLFEAFRAVRVATPAELGVTGPAFYREWAERFCRLGPSWWLPAYRLGWLAEQRRRTRPKRWQWKSISLALKERKKRSSGC
jgi:hypothetical protein